MTEWHRDTRITGSGQRFDTDLSGRWSVGGGINGGYLLAIVARAISETVPGKPDPFVLSAHYLSASVDGPATIRTRVVRDGGSVATVSAELSQDGEPRLAVLATFGDLARLDDEVTTTAVELELAPRQQCVSTEFAPPELRATAPLMERFDMLFDPSCIGWAMGEPSRIGELKAWFRLKNGVQPDPISLLLAVDALPPVTFDLGRPGWAPTIELTVHVRATPAPGWLKVGQRTRNLAGGMFEEDCEVWDSTGRLVAQARQLARVPRASRPDVNGRTSAAASSRSSADECAR